MLVKCWRRNGRKWPVSVNASIREGQLRAEVEQFRRLYEGTALELKEILEREERTSIRLEEERNGLRHRLLMAEDAAKKGEEARLNAGALEQGIADLRRQLESLLDTQPLP